jgi:hypothetical protein
MKKIVLPFFILLLAAVNPSIQAKSYFIATNGSNSNTGTITSPFFSIATAVSKASAGDTIYMRGGTYTLASTISLSASGSSTSSRRILWAYPGERALLDFSSMAIGSSNRGINLSGSYWYIKGIRIKGAGDNGMNISGSYNIIEFCDFFENRDGGCQLGGGAHDNQIINCDSYYNADYVSGSTSYTGGNADGFSPKLDVGTNNYFYGCRSWLNSDDGWDGYLRPSDGVTTTLENCWTWGNGYLRDGTTTTSNMNGNGFKMGGSDTKTLMHNFILKNCLSFYNKAKGFDQNNNKGSMTLYNCTAFSNTGNDYSISVALNSGQTCTIVNCVDYSSSKVSLGSFVSQITNSWQNSLVVNSSDFITIDTTGISGPRQADGSLPLVNFMHLATGSDLIDAGTDVGIAFNGTKPDLGAWETGNYTINTTVNGSGYILLNPVGGIYTPGTQVTLTAKPLSGNGFINWSGDCTGNQASTTVTLNSDISVTANFQVSSGVTILDTKKDGLLTCNPSIVKDNTTVKFYLAKAESLNISVYNVSGQKAIDFGCKNYFSGENSQEILISYLKPGAYILVARSKTIRLQCKMVKE